MHLKDEPFFLVFVHFGEEPPKTLSAFARVGLKRNRMAIPILISERPRPEIHFPGDTILYESSSLASRAFKRNNKHYVTMSSGYWAHTFERIFALSELGKRFSNYDAPVVHLESDVLPLFNKEDLYFLKRRFDNVSIPRFSQQRGIGSILYAPSISTLNSTLVKLGELAVKNIKHINDDMELLGLGLEVGIIDELPSHPSHYSRENFSESEHRLPLFDGAALGQYLFGRDPFHQSGLRISGFINPEYAETTNVRNFFWRCAPNEDYFDLMVESNRGVYKVANLHIHSKELLPELSDSNERWIRALREANQEQGRQIEVTNEVSPHARKPSIAERIHMAKKYGVAKTVWNYLKRRIK